MFTVLYIAFGVVALWLLAEVLLQHKARLRWRLVTFFGFLGVAIGVMASLVPLTVVGALAFGTGQTFVTLSHRRGFSTGWALGGKPGASRRRRGAPTAGDAHAEETYAADDAPGEPAAGDDADYGTDYASYDGSYGAADDSAATATFDAYTAQEGAADAYDGTYGGGYGGEQGYGYGGAAEEAPVYSPTPLPEDTGEYGVYPDRAGYGADPYAPAAGYEGWSPAPAPDDDVFANGAPATDPSYGGQQQYDPSYAQYGADPYGQGGGYDTYQQQPGYGQGGYGTGGYDPSGAPQQGDYAQTAYQQPQYGTGGYQQDPYQQQSYGYDATPADGTWNPQDPYGTPPQVPQQGAPGQDGTYEPYQGQGQGYGY